MSDLPVTRGSAIQWQLLNVLTVIPKIPTEFHIRKQKGNTHPWQRPLPHPCLDRQPSAWDRDPERPLPHPCPDSQPSAWDRDPGGAPLPPTSTLCEPAALGRVLWTGSEPRTPGKETQRQRLPTKPVAGTGVEGCVGLAKGPQPAPLGAGAELSARWDFLVASRGHVWF